MSRHLWMAIVWLGACVTVTHAAMTTFDFVGEITRIAGDSSILAGKIAAGSPFSGSVTFDSTTRDRAPSSGGGDYRSTNASLNVTIGNVSVAYSGEQIVIFVQNNAYGDAYGIDTNATCTVGDLRFVEFMPVYLSDATGTAFNGDVLPLVPPTLDAFQYRGFSANISGPNGKQADIVGTVLVLTPEPASIAIVSLLLALRISRRPLNHT